MEKDTGGNSIFSELFDGLIGVIGSILEAVIETAPKVLSFVLWALCAVLILPCVFVAGTFYERWVKWGEEL